jgi:hypothetical protein
LLLAARPSPQNPTALRRLLFAPLDLSFYGAGRRRCILRALLAGAPLLVLRVKHALHKVNVVEQVRCCHDLDAQLEQVARGRAMSKLSQEQGTLHIFTSPDPDKPARQQARDLLTLAGPLAQALGEQVSTRRPARSQHAHPQARPGAPRPPAHSTADRVRYGVRAAGRPARRGQALLVYGRALRRLRRRRHRLRHLDVRVSSAYCQNGPGFRGHARGKGGFPAAQRPSVNPRPHPAAQPVWRAGGSSKGAVPGAQHQHHPGEPLLPPLESLPPPLDLAGGSDRRACLAQKLA